MLPATLACPPNKNVVSLPIIPLTISPANVKTWEATHAILSTKKKQTNPHIQVFRKPIHSGLILLRGHIVRLLSAKRKNMNLKNCMWVFILRLVRKIVAGLLTVLT